MLLTLQGQGAEAAMQILCTNNVAVPPGRIVFTAMINQNGGFENDCTVTRLSQNKYVWALYPCTIIIICLPIGTMW